MFSRCWTSRCDCMVSFRISSLRRSCLVDVDVCCSGFMKAGSMRSLGLLPMANAMGVLPLRVTCVFLTVAALRINLAGVSCLVQFWEGVSTSAQRNFLRNRTPISPRFGQGLCGPVGSVLMLCMRIESLHVMRMAERLFSSDRFRVHLESVHPLMMFGNDFRWRGTFCMDMLLNVMLLHNDQKSKSFISIFCRSMVQKDEISKFFCP